MPQIECKIGKLNPNLPSAAWASIRGIAIDPCEGCQHHGHVKKLEEIKRSMASDALINLENLPVFSHNVSVIETFMNGPREELVMCECNCRLTHPNFQRSH